MTTARTPITMAPPTPTTTPIMIFLSESETPLLDLLLLSSPLSEGEEVSWAGLEVEVITWGTVVPLTVWYDVMVCTTGVLVVDEESDAEVDELSSLEDDVGSLFLDEVVFEGVSLVVSAALEDEEEVVGSALVLVGASDEDEEDEEEEEEEVVVGSALVVVGSAEVAGSDDELEESVVAVGTRSVTARL